MNDVEDNVKEEDLYVWIPRYAYNSNNATDVKFLYSSTNKIVNETGNLEELTESYIVDNKFVNKNGYWIKVSELSNDVVATRLNNSIYGQMQY